MTPSTISEPIKPRSGWRILGLMTLGMVILTIGGGFWWYFSDSDLEAVRQQARLQGRPLSWSEMGLKLADPERLRMWKRVTELTGQLKSYQKIHESPKKGEPILKMWSPIPQEVRDYHQSLDGMAIAELIDLLDRLGDQSLVLHDQLTYESKLPEIQVNRELIRFLQERMILAESLDAVKWGQRMLALCRRYSADSLMPHLVRNSFVAIAMESIAFRLEDLKQTDLSIANDIFTITEDIHPNLFHALDGEFLMILDVCTRRETYSGDWYSRLIFRSGRHIVLSSFLNAHRELHLLDEQGSRTWARATETNFSEAEMGIKYPSIVLQGLLMPAWNMMIITDQRIALRGRLLAAELQGQSWPIDIFDKTGAFLRPITRDGRVIAAYSVGDDGIDQGGIEKKDLVFPLYAKP
jgi:hypothetical protein